MQNYELFVQNTEKWKSICDKDYFLSDKKVECRTIKNGIALPIKRVKSPVAIDWIAEGGIVDENFNFVAGRIRNLDHEMNKECRRGYFVSDKNLSVVHKCVCFGGILESHFGHFFTDCFTRLWWPVEHIDEFDELVFLIANEEKKFFKDFFTLMGLPLEKIAYIAEPTRFDEIIVPDESFHIHSGYTDKACIIYDKIRSNLPQSMILLERNILKIFFKSKVSKLLRLKNCHCQNNFQ